MDPVETKNERKFHLYALPVANNPVAPMVKSCRGDDIESIKIKTERNFHLVALLVVKSPMASRLES